MESENDYSDYEDNGYDSESEFDDTNHRLSRKNYEVLSSSEVGTCMEDYITTVSTVLSVARDSAITLLLSYNWRVNTVEEEWFGDEEKVREAVGLLENPVVENSEKKEEKIKCLICLENCPVDMMKSAACGHLFCDVCWAGYVRTAINDGRGCLTLCCPFPGCKAAVGRDMTLSIASDEEKEKYSRYFRRSFVEDCKNTKWCPAPDCEFAVRFDGCEDYDVCCGCSYSFCWNCTQESHRPLDCDTVAQWLIKNSSESENVTWILANSKPCPKCKRPIEKNHGCMHMVCSAPCKFEFCWLCLGPWSEHGKNTGGYYACNKYDEAKKTRKFSEQERQREMAKKSLERYTHYYERWANNQKSQDRAAKDLERMRSMRIKKLIRTQHQTEGQLYFIIKAWEQIVECRQFLKWTYAYGYYFPQDQLAKKEFFEYLQGEAESGLEKLHHCAEIELDTYIAAEGIRDGFMDFRTKLVGLTSVTKSFFENLAGALENGLKDVESHT